jgi:hypothetical protein
MLHPKNKWAKLRAHPHWDEIETRLRYRQSPREVVAWHARRYPGEYCPSRERLRKFLLDKPEDWYVFGDVGRGLHQGPREAAPGDPGAGLDA